MTLVALTDLCSWNSMCSYRLEGLFCPNYHVVLRVLSILILYFPVDILWKLLLLVFHNFIALCAGSEPLIS